MKREREQVLFIVQEHSKRAGVMCVISVSVTKADRVTPKKSYLEIAFVKLESVKNFPVPGIVNPVNTDNQIRECELQLMRTP